MTHSTSQLDSSETQLHRPAIQLNNLHLTLGNNVILDDVSTHFNAGELTVLLGPNGTGKSSLLKLITREWPSRGSVHYFDKAAEHWRPEVLAKHLGVLPQASNLTFNFSVREGVELGGIPPNASQAEIGTLAEKNMQRTDVTHLADRLYPTLSGGEKQRVHLARVLTQLEQSQVNLMAPNGSEPSDSQRQHNHAEQKILLLDEPTSALDLSHQHNTLMLAKQLAKQGAAVVIVMHDLNLASQYADRMLILNQGNIVADGTPWQVLTAETIAAVYNWQVTIMAHPQHGYPVMLS